MIFNLKRPKFECTQDVEGDYHGLDLDTVFPASEKRYLGRLEGGIQSPGGGTGPLVEGCSVLPAPALERGFPGKAQPAEV